MKGLTLRFRALPKVSARICNPERLDGYIVEIIKASLVAFHN